MTTQQHVDGYGIIVSDETIERIVALVLERIAEMQRPKLLRVREAILMDLRTFEDLHDLPRAIPTKVERGDASPKSGHHNR